MTSSCETPNFCSSSRSFLLVLRDPAPVEVDPRRVLLLLQRVRVLADRDLGDRHLPVDVLEDADGAVEHGGREVRGADQLRHVGDLLVDRGFDARQGLGALLDRARLELHPLDVFVERADLLEAAEDAVDPAGRAVVERLANLRLLFVLLVRSVDELVDDARVAAGVLEELQDLLEHDRVVRERLVDLRLALLDALGDADLALAVEELDRPHLAQVHAHGVVGLLDRFAGLVRRLRGFERRAAPGGAVRIGHDLDADLEEALVDPARGPSAPPSPRPRGSSGSPRRGGSPSPGPPSGGARPQGTFPQSPSSFPFHRGARPSAAFRRMISCFRRINSARSPDPSPARSIAL